MLRRMIWVMPIDVYLRTRDTLQQPEIADAIQDCVRPAAVSIGPGAHLENHSPHSFSPRWMRSDISAWNAGGPNANHSPLI